MEITINSPMVSFVDILDVSKF